MEFRARLGTPGGEVIEGVYVADNEAKLRHGTMRPENAAALVGAGVLSVLVLPAAAVAVYRRAGSDRVPPERPAVSPTA